MTGEPVTIVTGASRGIGAAIAVALAATGHRVVLGYLRSPDAAATVLDRIRRAGGDGVTVAGDTAVEADVERLFDTAEERLGPVTGLVNNAGVTSRWARLADTSTADLRRVVETNLIGYLLCARRAARVMRRGSAIVNISSVAATLGSPGEFVHYAATKAAAEALTVGLSKELAVDGIRVNAVAPGLVLTDTFTAAGNVLPANVGELLPFGRPGEPEEIAAAVVWLLSPAASYTSGAVIRVAGAL